MSSPELPRRTLHVIHGHDTLAVLTVPPMTESQSATIAVPVSGNQRFPEAILGDELIRGQRLVHFRREMAEADQDGLAGFLERMARKLGNCVLGREIQHQPAHPNASVVHRASEVAIAHGLIQ